jgi:hypothetical protein
MPAPAVRARVHTRYAEAIEPWRRSGGCELPGEFVLVAAVARPASPGSGKAG